MKKNFLLLSVFCIAGLISNAQLTTTSTWAYIKGDTSLPQYAVYGTQGVAASANTPGAREGSISWKDASGNLWMFGGDGKLKDGVTEGYLNDLWKYDPVANQWTWVKGDSSRNSNGVYGTLGTSAAGNKPGGRSYGVSWADGSGNLWLFGGYGFPETGSQGNLNDLWKYNIASTQWTWVSGDKIISVAGVYGVQGTPAAGNKPGARQKAVSWIDGTGNLWLFGGDASTFGSSEMNDLWEYNTGTNQWVWLKGDNTINNFGTYGTLGVSAAGNKPGSRRGSVSWIDNSGNLWLFGGLGKGLSPSDGYLNDMWKYTTGTNQWTWIAGSNTDNKYGVYGTLGAAAASNTPGSRFTTMSWKDASGKLWLFGGYGNAASTFGPLNDLWKFDPATSQWAWMKGDSTSYKSGIYGSKGVTGSANKPGSRSLSVTWADGSGNLWLFGGTGLSSSVGQNKLNDLWKYNIAANQWTWMKGDNSLFILGSYGTQGVPAAGNKPGARERCTTWRDLSGNLWLFGGKHNGLTNDLWKYSPANNQWTWMHGDTIPYAKGRYGTQGIASALNKPGARQGGVSWTDSIGNLWLFGGAAGDEGGDYIDSFNDLWKYNIASNQWTWKKGDTVINGDNDYGTIGVAAASNKPAARAGAVSWIDPAGKLWLFGGSVPDTIGFSMQPFNDLWKYDTVTNYWTWVKGDGNPNYGTLGVPADANQPPQREYAVTWTDNSGNLWLFGGEGYGGKNDDLWKYNRGTNQWVWIKGNSTTNHYGAYGTQGTSAALNNPGSRTMATAWKDLSGNFWLFGGYGYAASGGFGFDQLNDLWKYDTLTNQWTWVKGDNSRNSLGFYGTQGVEGPANKPGARQGAVSWADGYGNFWLFGGYGYTALARDYLNDLWKIYTGTKYVFNGNGAWSDPAQWLNNNVPPSTIIGGMDVTIDHTPALPTGLCTHTGNLILLQWGKLTINSGKRIKIVGDLTNAGDLIGPGDILFQSGSPSALSSSGSITAPLSLSGKQMFLTGNTNTSSIDLQAGSNITLNGFNLNMGTGTLTGNNSNYIITNGSGSLSHIANSSPFIFHVGYATGSYTPATITNTGTSDTFSVRVAPGVTTSGRPAAPVTSGNVNRTWYIQESVAGGSNANLNLQWNLADEQPGFLRSSSYISHFLVCPPPTNCETGFYDASPRGPASGSDPFTQFRNNVTGFISPSFIITSQDVVYNFVNTTGNGLWNNPLNWTNERVPPDTIIPGMDVTINPLTGNECIFIGTLFIQPGSKLTVAPGKKLTIKPN